MFVYRYFSVKRASEKEMAQNCPNLYFYHPWIIKKMQKVYEATNTCTRSPQVPLANKSRLSIS